MAVINQDIYIGSVSSPLFYFDKDHIEEPNSIQNVDLIEQNLSIDTFEPLVYYDGTNYTGLRTLPFGTPVFYYANGTLLHKFYIDKIERRSKTAFKLSCISAVGLLDKSYHVGGIYSGKTFRNLAREIATRRITEAAPDASSITSYGVTVKADNEYVQLNGTASRSFVVNLGDKKPLAVSINLTTFYGTNIYSLPLISGHTYKMVCEFVSGSVAKSGTTYTPSSTSFTTLFRALLMKDVQQSTASFAANALLMTTEFNNTSDTVLATTASGGVVLYIYSGVTFTNAKFKVYLEDLSEPAYTMDTDVADTRVFGWLPYDTKRNNLHQVMFAENISIVKNADGDMHFTYAKPSSTIPTIPQDRIYVGGTIKYPAVATRIMLSEHSYQDVDIMEPVTLMDNSDKSPERNKLYIFNNAPIVVNSIVASEGLTINECGVNYAIVTGQGTLTGRPYYDKVSIIERSYNSGGNDYAVTVDSATLVTGVNSENVADRLLSYYTSAETVSADVKLSGEKCGKIYQFVDMFGDTIQAFLTKMTSVISSFVKATCEFIAGYVPSTFGNNYDYWGCVRGNGTDSYIEIPSGTKLIKFVIIGGGDGGSSGLKGIDDNNDLMAGSKGGEAGLAGEGGWIREIVIRNPAAGRYMCSAGVGGTAGAACSDSYTRAAENIGGTGAASTVTTPSGTVYSSDPNVDSAAYRSVNGIKNIFTDDVYACKGRDGSKGGDGGRGSSSGNGEDGEDITFNGVTRKGGKGGTGINFQFRNVEQKLSNGGAGGSGAQAYADGLDGGSVTILEYHDETQSHSGYMAYEYGKHEQAAPARNITMVNWNQDQNYGEGGDGGQGGAGRGGFGSANSYYQSYTDTTTSATSKKIYLDMHTDDNWVPTAFTSANGSAGKPGKSGIVLCYSSSPITVYDPQYASVTLGYTGYSDNKLYYFFK